MKSRLKIVLLLVVVAVVGGGFWLERSYGLITPDAKGGNQEAKDRQARRNAAKKSKQVTPGQRSLAFDVASRDYRAAASYVLEITDSAGQVTKHDLKKPRRQRGTITVPLPSLAAGKYQVVVVAQGAGGASRSAPLQVDIP